MRTELSPNEHAKYLCAEKAAAFVSSGMKVGLGTGSTAYWLVKHLGRKVRDEGLIIEGVPTSLKTSELAKSEGIPLSTLDEAGWLDITIDGADEISPSFNLIKGGGGAHLREKIVAMASDKMIVIADSSKKVAELGSFPLPVEVIRYGCELTKIQVVQYLTQRGYKDAQVMYRMSKDKKFITDEGNFILDLHLNFISDEATLSNDLNLIPGVVENGLFVNICKCVVFADENGQVTVDWKESENPNS
tara:strand:+ start:2198 stop:2935 length:738 start_codon:yes stop_codon:yes gene_type:complete